MRSTLLILALSISNILYSQNFTISNLLDNVVYVGIENPLNISVENNSSKSIILKTNNGALIKYKDGGYNYLPNTIGLAKIDIYIKTNNRLKKVREQKFLAKEVPLPIAIVGTSKGGEINKNDFVAQFGVRAEYVITIESSIKVDTFSIIILKEDSTYFMHKNTGAAFDQTIKDALSQLQVGDKIFITDIKATYGNYKSALLKSIEFEIH